MKLIIPMAGRGTRLRPHSNTTPKPLLPVAGTMIVERIIQTFSKTLDRPIDEIVFVLGDFGDEIKNKLADMAKRNNAKAAFTRQDEALGTAHAVYCAEKYLEGEVIVVFADTLFDTDGKVTLDDADSVIWLKEVEDPSRFGVALHEGEKITGFVEKPSEPISRMAIIGVYYFKDGAELRSEIKYLLDNDIKGHGNEFQLTDAIDRLLKGGKVFKAATVDEWLDCGTIPAWLETTGVILEKEKHQVRGDVSGSEIIEPVYIPEGVVINNSRVGPHVSLETGTEIHDSTLEYTIVQDHAMIQSSVLKNSSIGSYASVNGFAGSAHLGDHSEIEG
ncbi:MAG: sugar nucleotidyltransferase [Cyclonatronaceae bacterium]